ncbi:MULTISPECIES: hypothetical protein [Janthinobacterium]|jgi:hypothetical protein|uniref:Uncharacterized protein n=1 Tax=Janthinobacterium violaceinigrum TaxID=2654252 RepID=A0A6I1I0R0_9BURK|nr:MULTISPECIES: hypothetical protein [Janthinobacterium]KAB8063119.1 hypothetical protein GCN75_20190 [Janthinobacterium violaceinigrum]MCX7291604.1 hypothetical protein [Janthinobacterium sp.]MED5597405.1 hypothetical protein [Janthinobacterium sp. P210006]
MFATAYLATLRRMLPVFLGAALSSLLALWWSNAASLATPAIWLALLATYLLCALLFTPLARQNRQLATRHVRHGKPR